MAHFWLDLLWLRTLIEPKRTATVAPRIIPFDVGDEAITSGQPVAVQCAVSEGDLPIKFRWSFHGKELSSQMGISTVRLNSRMSLLSIDSIAAGHAGDYTCTAQNSAGQANHTAVLLVQGSFVNKQKKMFFFPNATNSLPSHPRVAPPLHSEIRSRIDGDVVIGLV